MLLTLAIVFLILALVSALFGFGGVAAAFATVARFLLIIFLVLFVVALVIALA